MLFNVGCDCLCPDPDTVFIVGREDSSSPNYAIRRVSIPATGSGSTVWGLRSPTSLNSPVWPCAFAPRLTPEGKGRLAIVFGSSSPNEDNVFVYDEDGTFLWGYNHGGADINIFVDGVAIDSEHNVYFGGVRHSDVSVGKLDPDGNLLWGEDAGPRVQGVDVHSNGTVGIVGNRENNLTTYLVDADNGSILETADHGANVLDCAFDLDGNLITVGTRASNLTTRKYDSSLGLLWSQDEGIIAFTRPRLATDRDGGDIYVASANTSAGAGATRTSVRRRSASTGAVVWEDLSIPVEFWPEPVAVSDDVIYVGSAGDTGAVWKLRKSDGDREGIFAHGHQVRGLDILRGRTGAHA